MDSFRTIFLLTLLSCICFSLGNSELVLKQVSRQLDLQSQLPRLSGSAIFYNDDVQSHSDFLFTFTPEQHQFLSDFKCSEDTPSNFIKTSKPVEKKHEDGFSYFEYRVSFMKSLEPKESKTIFFHVIYANALSPLPAEITQDEPQLVVMKEHHFLFSPYLCVKQDFNVRFPSSAKIEDYTEQFPSELRGEQLRFGPYEELQPFSVSVCSLHFETPAPLVRFTSVLREIEVSHWGNVAIQEHFEALHYGPKLVGPFTRLHFQQRGAPSAVRSLAQVLPPSAKDIYYRDGIGNVSTSSVIRDEENNRIVLAMQPRFPLFGGWKVSFYTGYNLPLEEFLSYHTSQPQLFTLSIPFADTFGEYPATDHHTTRIILPEGAKNIEFQAPFEMDEHSFDQRFTYLDTIGRPVLILKKAKVNFVHDQNIQVTYQLDSTTVYQKPLLLVTAFFLFLLACIFYVRIDFSITSDSVVQSQKKADDKLAKLKQLQEQRLQEYKKLDEVLDRFSKNKTVSQFNSDKKLSLSALTNISKEVQKICSELASLDSSAASRARQLEAKEQDRLKCIEQIHAVELKTFKKNELKIQARNAANEQLLLAEDQCDRLFSDLSDQI